MDIHSTTCFGEGNERIELTLLEEPVGIGLVGMIHSEMLKSDIAIVVDREKSEDYNFACFGWGEGGIAPRIIFQLEFLAELRSGTDEAFTVLFHELGHYCHGDLADQEYIQNQYDADRESCASQGQIHPMELAADAFAAKHLGGDRVENGLKALMHRMQKIHDSDLAIQEVRTRITAIGAYTANSQLKKL